MGPRHMRQLYVSLGLSLLAAGCVDDPGQPAPTLSSAGTYAVTSHFDLTVETALPPPASDAVEILRLVRDDPSAGLFEALDRAGVPLADELLSALPGVVQDRLGAAIDSYVSGVRFHGYTVAQIIDGFLDNTDTVLGGFGLESELVLSDDPDGAAMHSARRVLIRNNPYLDPIAFDLDGLFEVETAAHRSGLGAGSDALALDPHGFGIDYGAMAWVAFDASVQEAWQTDLAGVLRDAIDCPALAADVADECVLDVCIGHEGEVRELCDAGVDAIAAEVEERIRALHLDLLHLADGRAGLYDLAPGDGVADEIGSGNWHAAVDFGTGARPVASSFSAVRVAPY
jgi:hypothetical protein